MPDREKVIGSLQEAAAYFRSSFDAMYGTVACEKFRGWTDAIEQALALLKAQEPVEPKTESSGSGVTWWYVCGACLTAINPNDKFCHECGQAVKWE